MENNPFPFDAHDNTPHNTPNILVPAYENSARRSLYIAFIAFLAGIIIGIGSYRIWPGISGEYADIRESGDRRASFFGESEGIVLDNGTEEGAGGVSASPDEGVIIVTEQSAGDTVAVSLITIEKESWVAIHEDRNGKPGNILGAQFFPAGTNSGTIELLRATEEGKTYYAVLRGDDGNRQFDYTKDLPLADGAGKEISVPFTTTANPI